MKHFIKQLNKIAADKKKEKELDEKEKENGKEDEDEDEELDELDDNINFKIDEDLPLDDRNEEDANENDENDEDDNDDSDDENEDLPLDDDENVNDPFADLFSSEKSPIEQAVTQSTSQVNNSTYQSKLLEHTFRNLAMEGRIILKDMEDYKFKFIQSLNIMKSNPQVKQKMDQKKKLVESITAQLYGVIFDLENFDLTPLYDEAQLSPSPMPQSQGIDDPNADFAVEDEDLPLEEDEEDKAETETDTKDKGPEADFGNEINEKEEK